MSHGPPLREVAIKAPSHTGPVAAGKPAPESAVLHGGTERVATGLRRAARLTARDIAERTLARALILVPTDEGEPRR